MDNIYIIGHKNPDLDSVASSISYAYLKNHIDSNNNYVPLLSGEINEETKYILEKYGFKKPKIIHDLKTKINDVMKYPLYCFEKNTILDSILKMIKSSVDTLVVIDDNRKVKGVVTLNFLCNHFLNDFLSNNLNYYSISFDHFLKKCNSFYDYKYNNEIKGSVSFSSDFKNFGSSKNEFTENDSDLKDRILIIPFSKFNFNDLRNFSEVNQNSKKVNISSVIITNVSNDLSSKIEENINSQDTDYDFNIIFSKSKSIKITKLLMFSQRIGSIMNRKFFSFYPNQNLNENRKSILNRNYSIPVIDHKNHLIGVLGKKEVLKEKKRSIILVDHNEYNLSVDGLLDNANILEIVDHHKLGDIRTTKPINIDIEPVGSTATLIYEKFIRFDLNIPKEIGGLLLSAILSDTLILTSPTVTKRDLNAVKNLSNSLKVDFKKLGKEIFNSNDNLIDKPIKEVFEIDKKSYNYNDFNFSISQIQLVNSKNFLKREKEIINYMNQIINNSNFDFIIFLITDILDKKSYLLYSISNSTSINLEYLFDKFNNYDSFKIVSFLSRKRELLPFLYSFLKDYK
ncbi:MAG: putative manganese-dependent inorganic diphosphatase [Candidatus Woesearchaeota archaeon]